MEQRAEFVIRAMRTDNFRALCAEYGISPKTGYKWQKRFIAHGLEGLAEETRRPHAHAEQLDEAEVCQIVRLKQRHPHWGPRKLRALHLRHHGQAASESSFKRVLARAGLTEPRRRCQRATTTGRLWTGRQGQAPNEVWTVDFKGWWYDPQGRRCATNTAGTYWNCGGCPMRGRRRCSNVLNGSLSGTGCPGPFAVTTGAPLPRCAGYWG